MNGLSEDPEHEGFGIGIDVGSTLAKIAIPGKDGDFVFALLDCCCLDNIVRFVLDLKADFCGVTGSGAAEFKYKMRCLDKEKKIRVPQIFCVNEFIAWGTGAARLLSGLEDQELSQPYLLGSVGTGTSIMLINSFSITRVGGTALGGGTILGLGKLLTKCEDFQEMCVLASEGQRSKVDLMLKDIYTPGQVAISSKATASNFGGWIGKKNKHPKEADIMAGLMGLVGENISLIASGLMNFHRVNTIVYAGSTLRCNPVLSSVLTDSAKILGHKAVILENGEFSGAVGSYQLGLHSVL